jgi:transcriptional regulator with XRE-family HTH domain
MKSLKELREHNNLKQREVAQHIGVSDRVYAYYEKGRTLPAKYVKPLANLFGVSCDEFLENLQDERLWISEIHTNRTLEFRPCSYEQMVQNSINYYYAYHFVDIDLIQCSIEVDFEEDYICINRGNFTPVVIENVNKENYTIACKRARDLFLGDNNEF